MFEECKASRASTISVMYSFALLSGKILSISKYWLRSPPEA
jgi:hypothetical protein